MRRVGATLALAAAALTMSAPATADDADSNIFFFSMRAPDVEPLPRFVSASPTATDAQTAQITACNGTAYFLTPDDAAAVQSALANNNTVQLVSGPSGTEADQTSVVCLMQSSS
jgi:hypothetical protein